MATHDVPPHDMLSFGHPPDPLDDALRGGSGDPAVDALVRDVRSAYVPEGVRPRSAALAAFAGAGDEVPVGAVGCLPAAVAAAERPVPLGRRAAVAAAAFAATLTGKVVLGGAVAAAALGGLHATDTVDVPLLPRSPQAQTVPSTVPDLPDAASDPLSVLVGPPAGALERTPVPDVPARGVPAPVVRQSDRGPSSEDEPAHAGEGRTGPATPPPTADAPTTAGPTPRPGQPDGPAPAQGAPQDPPAGAPADTDPAADPAAGPDHESLVPATDEQKTSARP